MLIPVTSYVKRFLEIEYGPGPYYLDTQNAIRSRLRICFLSTHTTGILYPSLYTHATVHVDISGSPLLIEYYEKYKAAFLRGCFAADDFFYSFYLQVRTLHDYYGLTFDEAIKKFIQKYGISEDEYSFDNMSRQIRRLERKRTEYFRLPKSDSEYESILNFRMVPIMHRNNQDA